MKQLTRILQILLGVTFLFSAYTKAVGPGFFEITLMDQGLAANRALAGHMARSAAQLMWRIAPSTPEDGKWTKTPPVVDFFVMAILPCK